MLADIYSGLAVICKGVFISVKFPSHPFLLPQPQQKKRRTKQKKIPTSSLLVLIFHETKIPHNIYRKCFVLCSVDPNCSESSSRVQTNESSFLVLPPPNPPPLELVI